MQKLINVIIDNYIFGLNEDTRELYQLQFEKNHIIKIEDKFKFGDSFQYDVKKWILTKFGINITLGILKIGEIENNLIKFWIPFDIITWNKHYINSVEPIKEIIENDFNESQTKVRKIKHKSVVNIIKEDIIVKKSKSEKSEKSVKPEIVKKEKLNKTKPEKKKFKISSSSNFNLF